ncbi:Uncharacterised protein [uncultured Ruminococcus sp.]|nr:Uncharacterised protein [uncultured Ruminococcus sp.]
MERKFSIPRGPVFRLSFFAVFPAVVFFMGDFFFWQFLLSEPDRFQNRGGFDPVLPAAVQDSFQIGFGGHGGGILVRAVHGVSHDFMPDPILIYYHNRFFPVQVGKALVMVQMPFIPFGDPPEDTVHIASFFRQDSGDAIPAAVHAKGKAVPFQPDGIHHFRIGAAEGHLV